MQAYSYLARYLIHSVLLSYALLSFTLPSAASLLDVEAVGSGSTNQYSATQAPSGLLPVQQPGWKIVNYWSKTCAPCRLEIPELNLLKDELTGSNIQVLGVNFDEDDRATTLRVARRLKIDFPTLTLTEVEALGIEPPSALPTTYILSPTNEVLAKLVGLQTKASIYAKLAALRISH